MSRTVLQIPISTDLRNKAQKAALSEGFSSLQEAVRVILNKMAQKRISFSINEPIQLSAKAAKRYDKMIDDIESGKVKTKSFSDVESLMKHLNK